MKTIFPQNIRITMKIEITIETMKEMKMIKMETTMEITIETMKEMKVIIIVWPEVCQIVGSQEEI